MSLTQWVCLGGAASFHFSKIERRASNEAKARVVCFATGSCSSSGATVNSATRGSRSILCVRISERVSKTEHQKEKDKTSTYELGRHLDFYTYHILEKHLDIFWKVLL